LTENHDRSPASNGAIPSAAAAAQQTGDAGRGTDARLSKREREIVSMLASGESGAQIADRLVLSPETVRTHIRNAMAKLGASSRAQAVALAVQQREINWPGSSSTPEGIERESPSSASSGPSQSRSTIVAAGQADAALTVLLSDLVTLYDVDGGMIFLTEEDGLSLRQVAVRGNQDRKPPGRIQLGEGPLGRVALERRAQLVHGSGYREQSTATMCVPMMAVGRLVGVICLTVRPSRLIGRSELLLLQAFAGRIAEVLLSGENHRERRLKTAVERFRASWSSSSR
jgi:DNA-binding CsgD family transcriptional regulator